ncbi:ABC transporter ATP-binding protein [Paenibacillus antri]|uniref:ABC transporter ATP-binding protein n=1 Tax=Paenibacillus antri TaxID=2582848 RepID=A0A5R9G7Y6_9BACL|nr:ABC transporter ATP-binding protein [Paenibacillus antri]TLS51179.1 ABC transporter ATP-binding protein [Paenibacillus antri]
MIRLEGVSKTYRNGAVEVQALKPLDLTIEKGEYVAIMGPSGSGKSTLMNILGCLDTPSSGTYTLDGERVETLDEERLAQVRNKKIGFVFQNFHLLPRQSILRNVELPCVYGGVPRSQRTERAKELLGKVGLGERVHHRPNELSGGQRQRAAIARALAMEPSVLLADEPTGNLDAKSSEDIMRLFGQLHAEGATVILVTHEADIAAHAKRVLRFGDGDIVSDTRTVSEP